MKIDIFNHAMLPNTNELWKKFTGSDMNCMNVKLMADMDARCRDLDLYGDDVRQILTAGNPEALDTLPPEQAQDIARSSNDEMAEIVEKYPHRILAGVATISVQDIDAALKEIDRACGTLGLRGIQLVTTYHCKESMADEKYFPIYERMAELDLPILFHPWHGPNSVAEFVFNWPVETSWMMINLSTSGIFEKCPNIKFVTHHCGALIPTWHDRAYLSYYQNHMYPEKPNEPSPREYWLNLKKFYNDTAVYGDSRLAIEMAADFFGADHVMFGTDYPMDGNRDPESHGQLAETIASIEKTRLSEQEKKMIFEDNAVSVFRL